MNFSAFLPKLRTRDSSKETKSASKKKEAINTELLGVDLFCHLTYMAAISTSKLPRHIIFDYASKLPYISSRYIRDVTFLAHQLNYDYPEACRMIGQRAKEPEVRALLLRMSNSFASGEDEGEFLAREAAVAGEIYSEQYQRSVESLKKWTDAYTALILSAALIVVICVVSMLIFPMDKSTISVLTWFMLVAIMAGGWIMYRASPKEIKTHSLEVKSPEQQIGGKLFKVAVPLAGIAGLVSLIAGAPLGLTMLLLAVLLLPPGLVLFIDDRKIDKRDAEVGSFLRSLGSISKAIGATIAETLDRLDYNALHSLKSLAQKLKASLSFGITPQLCWQRFVGETGSETIHRSVRTFYDGVELGGDPEIIGTECADLAMKVSLLREKRRAVASSFSYLCIVMHAAIVALLVGIYQVILKFSEALQTAGESGAMEGLTGLPVFQLIHDTSQLSQLKLMTTALIIILTLVNPAAIQFVEGGHNYKYLFYLSICLAISGFCLLVVPSMVSSIFGFISIVK